MADDKKTLVERLFVEHGNALLKFLGRRVRRPADAAELAQEVYLRMLRVPDASLIRNPQAYLFTVANNLAREHALRERSFRDAVDVEDPAVQERFAQDPNVAEEIDSARCADRLREVMRHLPPKCRAALVLYGRASSYQEIAQQLGVSTHMVKKYLSQGLAHCRRRMALLE